MLDAFPDLKDMAISIAENSAQGIVVMDEHGYCLYANRAWREITGFAAADMADRPVHDWVHHHHPDGRPLPLEECPIGCTLGKRQNVRNHRDLFFRKDGTPLHVSCAASTMMSAGAPALKILEIRDISHEVAADRRKDEFLAMLAHELRNPLSPILAAANLLQLTRVDDPAVQQSSRIIARQVHHMSGLIDDLLDVSRVTRNQVDLDKAPQGLGSVLADALEQIRPLIDGRRHVLVADTASDAAMVLGDRKRLVQVFANIIGNAAKYTPDGGRIAVALRVDHGAVEVTVADNGIGMTPEMVGRAFDLFSQAERSSDRSQGGLGIGLALVRSLVFLHGGTVSMHSAGIGAGTTVTITLPRLPEPAAMEEAPPDMRATGMAPPQRIMIVEDARDAAETLGMLLRAAGHHVDVQFDPHAALHAAAGGVYDAFLLDVGLPGMDGIALARRIRQQARHTGALIVAITGYGQSHDRENAMAAGFDHHLVKPVDWATLQGLLAGHAARRA